MFRLIFLIFCCGFLFALDFNANSILNYTFDTDKNYDLNAAKRLFSNKQCATCHGESGEKIIKGKALKDLNANEIKSALSDFFLKERKSQVSAHIARLSNKEINLIIANVKGANFAEQDPKNQTINKEGKIETKTKHGIFIK